MSKKTEGFLLWCAIIVSAVICIFVFPPHRFHIFAWIGLVPFFIVLLNCRTPRMAMNAGFVWGYVFFVGTLHWFYYTVGIFGFLLLGILSLFPAIFAWLLSSVSKRNGIFTALVLAPFLWTGIEYFRCELWWLKFSFVALGYSQSTVVQNIQIADITGVYGVSFVIAAVNAAIAISLVSFHQHFIKRIKAPFIKVLSFVIVVVFMYLATCIYGNICLRREYNFGPEIKFMGIQSESPADALLKFTKEGIEKQKTDLQMVIWPEYSVQLYFDESFGVTENIRKLAVKNNLYFLYGGKDKAVNKRKIESDRKFYNTAFLIDPSGNIAGRAVKMNPIQLFNDGLPGRNYSVFTTRFGKVGVGICYDMDYTYLSRNLVKNGAQILVFPTLDDSSWGLDQHQQHAGMAAFRSVENRRNLVRVAGSGISQITDSHGIVIRSYGMKHEGSLIFEGKLSNQKTIYNRVGYLFGWICVSICFVVIVYIGASKNRSKTST